MIVKKDLRIVFMGTPEFAVNSLDALLKVGFNVVAVITSPDKPAGRGRKLQESAVKKYAIAHDLTILQPTNLKNEDFIAELRALRADLQIVVAFRMLPVKVWNMPLLGTFNLHASLLPQYRGAAPINWAIINGEHKTGVTTFFLAHQIDTGNIIYNAAVDILPDDNAGSLHDKLMVKGAGLIVRTVDAICEDKVKLIPQSQILIDELKAAPKIFKDDCKINWADGAERNYNFIRGLSPYPAAWTEFVLKDSTKIISAKIYRADIVEEKLTVGEILSDNKTFLKIGTGDKALEIREIQFSGKKRLKIADLLRGFDVNKIRVKR